MIDLPLKGQFLYQTKYVLKTTYLNITYLFVFTTLSFTFNKKYLSLSTLNSNPNVHFTNFCGEISWKERQPWFISVYFIIKQINI